MANLKNRMQSTLHALYRKGKGMKRREDPENRYIHSNNTLNVYLRQSAQFADWLKSRGIKSRCSEEDAAKYVQEYVNDLAAQGKSENTIHVAVAAICKALQVPGVEMSAYDKPRRTNPPRKGRGNAPSLAKRGDADLESEKYQHLVEFAKRVGIRRGEYGPLLGRDCVVMDGYTYIIVERGKGGKRQFQRIRMEDADFVRAYFSGLDPEERVFSKAELRNKLNLHALRRQHAQEMYQEYAWRMEREPGYRVQLLAEVRAAFERAGEDWHTNPDMRRIDKPYFCRGSIRRDMSGSGRSIRYDRLALMAVSVFHLAHWRCDVTVANYFR